MYISEGEFLVVLAVHIAAVNRSKHMELMKDLGLLCFQLQIIEPFFPKILSRQGRYAFPLINCKLSPLENVDAKRCAGEMSLCLCSERKMRGNRKGD